MYSLLVENLEITDCKDGAPVFLIEKFIRTLDKNLLLSRRHKGCAVLVYTAHKTMQSEIILEFTVKKRKNPSLSA